MADKIGYISHYYTGIGVGILEVEDKLIVGDKIKIKGHTTDIEQVVEEMQLNHENVKEAKSGDSIGIKVHDRVREGDEVFRA